MEKKKRACLKNKNITSTDYSLEYSRGIHPLFWFGYSDVYSNTTITITTLQPLNLLKTFHFIFHFMSTRTTMRIRRSIDHGRSDTTRHLYPSKRHGQLFLCILRLIKFSARAIIIVFRCNLDKLFRKFFRFQDFSLATSETELDNHRQYLFCDLRSCYLKRVPKRYY